LQSSNNELVIHVSAITILTVTERNGPGST
jgi:hypothetical protein